MLLYPDIYLRKVEDISIDLLNKNNIKGLILDIDNTLIDYDKKLEETTIKWCENLKKQGIKMCILSNTNKLYKVEKVAKALNLEYIYFAHKPNKKGFHDSKEKLNLPNEQIAVVGDQIYTDVLGGNRCKMFTILIVPRDTRDIWLTKLKRPFEKVIIKRLKITEKEGKK